MATDSDLEYFRVRAEQERARASFETRPEIRRIHLELASLYAEREQDAERLTHAPRLEIVTRQ